MSTPPLPHGPDPSSSGLEADELLVTEAIEDLLSSAGTEDLDRILAQTLVAHGLVSAAALWRREVRGDWTLRCASGPMDQLPASANVRAILTHGWSHELGLGGAILQEGDLALALGGVSEPSGDVLDQIDALLTIRQALGVDPLSDGWAGPLPA